MWPVILALACLYWPSNACRCVGFIMNIAALVLQRVANVTLARRVLNPAASSVDAVDDTGVDAIDVGKEVKLKLLKLKGKFVQVDEKTGSTFVRYGPMKASAEWRDYTNSANLLHRVRLQELGADQRKALLINVYNALVWHAQIGSASSVVQLRDPHVAHERC